MKNENAITQLKRMRMDKSLTADEHNAIIAAIKALETVDYILADLDHRVESMTIAHQPLIAGEADRIREKIRKKAGRK